MKRINTVLGALALSGLVAIVGCKKDETATTTPATDSGTTGTSDSGTTGTADSGTTGTADSGTTGTADSGTTGTADSGTTGTADSGTTGTADAGTTGTADGGTTGTADAGTDTTVAPPAPPVLGAQIDRFGRPAINTALNHPFDPDATAKGTAKDAYNADADPTKWAAAYGAEFAKNLAILDSLDTVCGNQLLAKKEVVADRYATLAGLMADDRLNVNTASGTCTVYLAVEANFIGVVNTDCGGRALSYDPIDASYSALAVGSLSGVGDGIDADADTKGTTFPYLAAPH